MIRIVKLSFKTEHIEDFKRYIDIKKMAIRAFEGCEGVEFLNDIQVPNIFFTYSHWRSELDLENYRKSELFQSVWSQVKVWFDAKAEAWSVHELNI